MRLSLAKIWGKRIKSVFSRANSGWQRRSNSEGYSPGSKIDVTSIQKSVVSQMSGVKLRFPKVPIRRGYSRIAVILVLVGIGYLVFGTRIFVLDTLKVEGQHLVNQDEIIKVLFPSGFSKVNALTYTDGRAKKKLLTKIPQIQSVSFNKNIFTKVLTVQVMEHETSIIWVTAGERYLVNRNGVAYEKAPDSSPLLPVEDIKNIPVSLNQQIVAPAFIDFVSSFVANLPRRTDITVRRIVVPETTFEVEMETDEGWKIILDTTGSYEEQLNNLVRVLRELPEDVEIKQYVDLRIGKKVFYK
jgi:cell division septal protein FtsQ